MKKVLMTMVMIMTLCLTLVHNPIKAEAGNVASLNVTATDEAINVSGTMDSGVVAAAIFVYAEDGKTLVTMKTTQVDSGNFSESIALEPGTYTVKVADYDGGEFASSDVTVGGKTIPELNTEEDLANGDFIAKEDVSVPTGSQVKITSVDIITDSAIISSIQKDLLSLETSAYEGKWDIVKVLAMELKASGKGAISIKVGDAYNGKIAIVSHFHDGKWTRQFCKVVNGVIEPKFDSFSPIYVAITDQTDTNAIIKSGVVENEPAVSANPAQTVKVKAPATGDDNINILAFVMIALALLLESTMIVKKIRK